MQLEMNQESRMVREMPVDHAVIRGFLSSHYTPAELDKIELMHQNTLSASPIQRNCHLIYLVPTWYQERNCIRALFQYKKQDILHTKDKRFEGIVMVNGDTDSQIESSSAYTDALLAQKAYPEIALSITRLGLNPTERNIGLLRKLIDGVA